MANLAKKEAILTGPPTRCARYDHLTGSSKDQYYNSWNYVPTIISDRDSDLIGDMIPQTQDVREEKVQHKSTSWHCKILGKWIMKAGPKTRVHHYAKERMRRWLMDSATIHREFQKDGFPQLSEQGVNICQIKRYNVVCSRKTYTINHWLEGEYEIWP